MFCKTHDKKILDMCPRRQIRMLEDHFGLKEETDDAPSDEGINVNSSSSRESSLERREVEPKLEPGDNEVQLQREERQARLEQEKAKAEQERAKAEQEKAKAEQEKAKAEQEKLKVGQERAKAEQETAKAELAMIKMEAAKAEQERIKMARRENRVKNEIVWSRALLPLTESGQGTPMAHDDVSGRLNKHASPSRT
ncbi:caldesmon-like [Procambarus clarkii]|uniref:caldesmon-like n=1 Tax=Procambarus clarkii TaxID=6728 RepID=UPI0037437E27